MFNPLPLKTEAEVVEEGSHAENLLSDPTFRDIMDSLAAQCANGFLLSAPGKPQERDSAYNLYSGLLAIKAELEHRVQLKDQIEAARDADSATE